MTEGAWPRVELGISTPTNRTLWALVKLRETTRGQV